MDASHCIHRNHVKPRSELAVPGRSGTFRKTCQLCLLPAAIPRAFILASSEWQVLDLGSMDIECSQCGVLHWKGECSYQSAVQNTWFTAYCKEGDVLLEPLKESPSLLHALSNESDNGFSEAYSQVQ
ncbi:hypothetical protein BDZ91DRAFT_710220 [Kalaharituber pfeilii]|nr:hypothetical protein BDZ91DRAFT_710220 [Kalaharituber pfeilii]